MKFEAHTKIQRKWNTMINMPHKIIGSESNNLMACTCFILPRDQSLQVTLSWYWNKCLNYRWES